MPWAEHSQPRETEGDEMLRTSETTKALFGAMAAAQADMPVVIKDSSAEVPTKSGGRYSYTYASLAGMLTAIRPVLTRHKLVLTHGVSSDGTKIKVETRVAHGESGEWIETEVGADAAASTPQAIGSVITYCRRYGVTALLSIATEDDDGEAGEGRGNGGGHRLVPSGATSTPRVAPPATVVQPTPAHVDAKPTIAPPIHLPGGSTVKVTGGPRAPQPPAPAGTMRFPAAPDAPVADDSFKFRVGKHKGMDAREVEVGYLRWYADAQEASPEKWEGKRWEADTRHEIAVCRAIIAKHDAQKEGPPPNNDPPLDAGGGDMDVPF